MPTNYVYMNCLPNTPNAAGLSPTTPMIIKQIADFDWLVYQKFVNWNDEEIIVRAFGTTRSEAISSFRGYLTCEMREIVKYGLADDIAGILWDISGWVDFILEILSGDWLSENYKKGK